MTSLLFFITIISVIIIVNFYYFVSFRVVNIRRRVVIHGPMLTDEKLHFLERSRELLHMTHHGENDKINLQQVAKDFFVSFKL